MEAKSVMKTLDSRSASAAKEITQLIKSSVDRVGRGAEMVDKANGTMDNIVVSAKRVSDIVGEISATTVEQSGGIQIVNSAISEID